MGRKRHRYTRDWSGWKCTKCGVKAFPTPQQFYRHWDKKHANEESRSEDSSAASSGLNASSSRSASGAAHSGAPPSNDQHSGACSAQPSGGGADGMEVQQDEGVVAAASEQAAAPSPDCHLKPNFGTAEVPEHLDSDLFYDAVVRPALPQVVQHQDLRLLPASASCASAECMTQQCA